MRAVFFAIAAGLLLAGSAVARAQDSAPATGLNFKEHLDSGSLRDLLDKAKFNALKQLRDAEGNVSVRVKALEPLSPSKFLERLAVDPIQGPSTIAAAKEGAPEPVASVNFVPGAGGLSTGDPGVAMLLARGDSGEPFSVACTGTLVNQSVILTAGHCFCYGHGFGAEDNYETGKLCREGDNLRPRSPFLEAGNWLVFFQHVGLRQVRQVSVVDDYLFSRTAVRNDVAVMVLSSPVTEIIPAALPAATDSASTWTNGEVVGFGFSANPNIAEATILQQLVRPGLKAAGEVTASPCQAAFLDATSSLCSLFNSGPDSSQATICMGDSGGPLRAAGSSDLEIGVTSGRNDADCTVQGSMSFQMAVAFPKHRDWIDQQIAQFGSAPDEGQWPTFGTNLRHVLDRRNGGSFDSTGAYYSEGWLVSSGDELVLATINSNGPIAEFHIEDRAGNVLCSGKAGTPKNIPPIDYCAASIPVAVQFRLVAHGKPNFLLQSVVSTHRRDAVID